MDKPELKRIKPSWKGIAFLVAATAVTLTVIFVKLANPRQIWAVIKSYPGNYLLFAFVSIILACRDTAIRSFSLPSAIGSSHTC